MSQQQQPQQSQNEEMIRQSRSSYQPIDSSEARASGAPGAQHSAKRFAKAAVAGAAALAAVAGVAGWSSGSSGGASSAPKLRHTDAFQQLNEAPTWEQGAKFDSQAPPMEIDVEYVYEGWGTNYDHIPDPEFCAAMCQSVEKCNAYTWVKEAGLDGCPSQCWLKGGVGTKKPKKGLVSGVPPPRKQLPAEMPAGDKKGGSLYCFSLMVPDGYETGILKWQHDNKAGIFGCEAAGVYSNKPVEVAGSVVAEVVNSTLKCGYGGDSMSALNSWIFIAVWQKVIEVGDYKAHDWVVKVDPDAVFFPDRLRNLLVPHMGKGGYINNCKYGMHGPIEVFSSQAINALAADYEKSWDGQAPATCVKNMHFGQWGEDMFIDQCLGKQLKVEPSPLETKLMCESHCDCPSWYWCNEGPDMVSYHPFKSIEAYSNCMSNAAGVKAISE